MRITSCFNVRSRTIILKTLLFADTHRCPWEANGFLSYCATHWTNTYHEKTFWEGLTKYLLSPKQHTMVSVLVRAKTSLGHPPYRSQPHRLQPHKPQPLNPHSPTGWLCPTDIYLLVARLVDCFMSEM